MAFGSHVFFLLCLLAEGARESTDEGVFVQVSRAGQTDAAATATWERQLTDDLPAAGLAVGNMDEKDWLKPQHRHSYGWLEDAWSAWLERELSFNSACARCLGQNWAGPHWVCICGA